MKILSYQSESTFGDTEANLKTIEIVCQAAAVLDIDVAVFPELFLTGYNLGQKLHELAEAVDGPSHVRLHAIAKSSGVAIVTGYPERDATAIYNSAVAIDSNGKRVGHHRKVHLFGKKDRQQFRSGDEFCVFELAGHKCALCICYDIEFPEVCREIRRQGAEIIFAPTANMVPYFDVPTTLARSRALENGLAIIYANMCGSEGDQTYTGLSAIIAPDGKDIARAGYDHTILIGDLGAALSRNVSRPQSSQLQDLKASNSVLQFPKEAGRS